MEAKEGGGGEWGGVKKEGSLPKRGDFCRDLPSPSRRDYQHAGKRIGPSPPSSRGWRGRGGGRGESLSSPERGVFFTLAVKGKTAAPPTTKILERNTS